MRCSSRFVAAACGRGSGKSEVARRRLVLALADPKPWPDPEYFYAAPTSDQARRLGWDKLKALVPPDWCRKINDSTMTIRTVFGATLRVFGLDKPMRAEGVQYDGGVIDESSDVKPKTFDLTFRPALSARRGWCWRIGVPKRFGCGAREFREFYDQCGADKTGDYAAFKWSSDTVLDAQELKVHQDSMDPRDYSEQFDASWESVSGAVYYCYDSHESIWQGDDYDREQELMVGSDFNVSPMAWTLLQERDGTLVAVDEIWKKDTNTRETLDELWQRYQYHAGGWHFYGDASGRARRSSADTTDYLQIRADVRFDKAKISYPRANPPVASRHAAVNWALRAASGKRSLMIHPRCLHLRRDLEYLTYKPGTREVDTRDPDAGHITDGLGYVIHALRPMRVSRPTEIRVGVF